MARRIKSPIPGAGYGGPFAGTGFDAIWLDMSEIVRPTRDGIHGREYISTAVDLGRRPEIIAPGELPALRLLELPIPVIFNPYPLPAPNRHPFVAVAMAAHRLHTRANIDPEEWNADLEPFAEALAPRVPLAHLEALRHLWARASYVELEGGDLADATARAPPGDSRTGGGWGAGLGPDTPQIAADLVRRGAAVW